MTYKFILLKITGILATLFAVVAVLYSLSSSFIGVQFALEALLLSGVSAVGGNIRYALITSVIVTFDLFFVSVLPQIWHQQTGFLALLIGIPYIITFALVGIGLRRRKKLK